jgi:hypothetical protein
MRGWAVRGDAELTLSESSSDDDSMLDLLAAFSPRLISVSGLTLWELSLLNVRTSCTSG